MLAAGILMRTPIVHDLFGPEPPTSEWVFSPLPPGPLPVAGAEAATIEAADPTAEPRIISAARAESTSFWSAALGRQMPYLVYLPSGYDSEAERRYPVLYMLHGLGGTYEEWYGYGIFDKTERLVSSGEVQPFIIVLPQGDVDYWVDHANGGPQWGAYVARDLVNEIDTRYRTVPAASARAIGGLSMGAHGAIQLALNYPGRFAVVGVHSPTLRGYDDAPKYFGDAEYFAAHDPVTLVREKTALARDLIVWLDVGTADWWLEPVSDFHNQLERLGLSHVWRVYPGGHDGSYWTTNLQDYLRFYGEALAQGGGAP